VEIVVAKHKSLPQGHIRVLAYYFKTCITTSGYDITHNAMAMCALHSLMRQKPYPCGGFKLIEVCFGL